MYLLYLEENKEPYLTVQQYFLKKDDSVFDRRAAQRGRLTNIRAMEPRDLLSCFMKAHNGPLGRHV